MRGRAAPAAALRAPPWRSSSTRHRSPRPSCSSTRQRCLRTGPHTRSTWPGLGPCARQSLRRRLGPRARQSLRRCLGPHAQRSPRRRLGHHTRQPSCYSHIRRRPSCYSHIRRRPPPPSPAHHPATAITRRWPSPQAFRPPPPLQAEPHLLQPGAAQRQAEGPPRCGHTLRTAWPPRRAPPNWLVAPLACG